MLNIKNLTSLLVSNLKYKYDHNQVNLKGKLILDDSNLRETFLMVSKQKRLKIAYVDNLTTLIIYEGLLIEKSIKKDFSDELIATLDNELSFLKCHFSSKSLAHMYKLLTKSLVGCDLIFYENNRFTRYILKTIDFDSCYLDKKYIPEFLEFLNVFLQNKKILSLSKYPDLIKMQYINLKSSNKYRTRFNYMLHPLQLEEMISKLDTSNVFNLIDNIKMKLLNYAFDTCLIQSNCISLILAGFMDSELKVSTICIDNSIFSMFNIVMNNSELLDSSSNYISIENYQKIASEDFSSISYLASTSLEDQTKEKESK